MRGMTCRRPIDREAPFQDSRRQRDPQLLRSAAGDDYFAALSRDASGVVTDGVATNGVAGNGVASDFGGGHVATRRSSAPTSPSLENFTECATRCPAGICDVSVNSSCARPASDRAEARSNRTPQISEPGDIERPKLKNSGLAPPFDIDTVGKIPLAIVLRWKASSN